ncbi:2-phospho-L-lactate guanylyltransferase [Nocardioides sp. LHD-245]|uniref:2-phospho-L-lactate guanylyltransferase n=1 Tax=Nocardioides sp. LHD-245 TaxID=3051387 RepID=UPI0027DFAF4E|nr:2-phospho-L-lactate guanylyltransferase [Nocardioides sp. LHD-245]
MRAYGSSACPDVQVLVPVKELDRAKSRLDVPDPARRELALAFVLDTVSTALRCEAAVEVVIGTRDAYVAARVTDLGARVVVPPAPGDLNGDIGWALGRLAPGRPTAVLVSDLPAMSLADLDEALTRARRRGTPRRVADLDGTGTTLLTAPDRRIEPRFGTGSAGRHSAAGMEPLGDDLAGLRCDVDDMQSLRRAIRLGVGPHTAAVLSSTSPDLLRDDCVVGASTGTTGK